MACRIFGIRRGNALCDRRPLYKRRSRESVHRAVYAPTSTIQDVGVAPGERRRTNGLDPLQQRWPRSAPVRRCPRSRHALRRRRHAVPVAFRGVSFRTCRLRRLAFSSHLCRLRRGLPHPMGLEMFPRSPEIFSTGSWPRSWAYALRGMRRRHQRVSAVTGGSGSALGPASP